MALLPLLALLASCQMLAGIDGYEIASTATGGQGGTAGSAGGTGGTGGQGGASGGGGSGPTYTIGGEVTGLVGSVTLQNGGADDLVLEAGGTFTFVTAVADQTAYDVTVSLPPGLQGCEVSNGAGTVSGANVTDVAVDCFDALFFQATNGVDGFELWKSDGTAAGTAMVRDIDTLGDSDPVGMTRFGDHVYFGATHPSSGRELWRTDGTEAGTELVQDINLGSGDGLYVTGVPNNLVVFDGALYFRAQDTPPDDQPQVWRTDGTTTAQVSHIFLSGGGPTGIQGLTPVGSAWMSFAALVNGAGLELYVTDGTWNGTGLLADINQGGNSSNPMSFHAHGGWLYFAARATQTEGMELWRSNGLQGGTSLVKDIDPAPGVGSNPSELTSFANRVFFSASEGYEIELWSTDGTSQQTTMFMDIITNESSAPRHLTVVGSDLYFIAYSGGNGGEDLWVTDGVTPPTQPLAVINAPGATVDRPDHFTAFGNKLFFFADDETGGGYEPWLADANSAARLADINPNGDSLVTFDLQLMVTQHVRPLGDKLTFYATDGAHGYELWITDGTQAGTTMVMDINPTGHSVATVL
ncbi:MAG: hypothetical protein JRI68_22830 [Deltaproteobacteria bacterium]|nr:hypothetical protein [Deltaproteobacteria bacterium]